MVITCTVEGEKQFIIVDSCIGRLHLTPFECLKLSDNLIDAVERLGNQTKTNYFREYGFPNLEARES